MKSLATLIFLLCSGSAVANGQSCYDAALNDATDADRSCSDLIAELSYQTPVTVSDRQALASAFNNRALARMAADELEGAAADLGEAITLAPDNWAILLNRGNLHLTSGNPQAALADYERVLAAAPEQADAVRRNSILAWRSLGNLAAAERLLRSETARSVEPERPPR